MLKTAQRFRPVTFVPAHLDCFIVPQSLRAAAEHGVAMTLWDYQHDCPSAVIGMAPYWPGVGMVWMHYNECPGDSVAVARFVRRELEAIRGKYRRIEAYVLTHDLRARRFLEWLGFILLLEKPGFGPLGQTMTECALATR